MWYSYTREETTNFIALSVERIHEIIASNKKGIKVKAESDEPKENKNVATEQTLDFKNVVGQESITRFDEQKNRNRNKNKHHQRFNKPNRTNETKK
jgi:hypothetical protein